MSFETKEEMVTLRIRDKSFPVRKDWLIVSRNDTMKGENKLNQMSGLIRIIFETDSPLEVQLSSPVFKNDTLSELFMEYVNKCQGNLPVFPDVPLTSNDMKMVVPESHKWMAEFLDKIPLRTIYDFIGVANYLDSTSLLWYLCAKVGSLVKGKGVEEIEGILTPK